VRLPGRRGHAAVATNLVSGSIPASAADKPHNRVAMPSLSSAMRSPAYGRYLDTLRRMELTHEGRGWPVAWVALVLGAGLASMLAFLLTQARCGAITMRTLVSTSAYCRALGAPGLSSDLQGVVLAALLFVAPAVALLAGRSYSVAAVVWCCDGSRSAHSGSSG
jgi:hypothetical protein